MPLFHLSTRDAARKPHPGDATWFLPFTDTSSQYETVSVVSIGFNNPIKTINANKNDQISFTITRDASTYTTTATIPEGNYTGSSLATAITELMYAATSSAHNSWVSYATNFAQLYVQPEVGHTRTITFHSISNDAYTQMGVVVETTYASPDEYFTYPVNLHYTDFLDFIGDNFASSDQFNSAGTRSIVARIPLENAYATYLLYEPKFATPITFNANRFMSMTIRVIDQFGEEVVFPQNWPITYTFNLTFTE